MTLVGSAEVLIKAVDTGFESDVKTKVKRSVDKADSTVTIKADTKQAEGSIAKLGNVTTKGLDDITSRLTSGLGPASGEAKAALDKVATSGSLIGPAVAGGVAIAGAAIAAFAIDGAQKFVKLAAEIRGFQRVSGASAEDSSRLVAVLDDLGVSAQTGGNAIFLLSKKIAAGGEDLRKLGIEVASTADGNVDLIATLLNVADAYAAQPDQAKRAEIAFAGFGRQGKELIPVLEQGRAGLEKFFKSAEGGRQIFSADDLAKARQFELQMDDLSDTFRGLQLEAGEAALPFITSLAKATTTVISFADTVKSKFGDAIKTGGRVVAGFLTGGASEAALFAFRKLSDGGDKAKVSQKELAEQAKLTAAAQEEEADASAKQAAALDKVTTATLSAVSSQLGYESSLNRLLDNINDMDDRTQEYSDAVDAAAEAHRLADVAVRQYGRGSDEAREATEKAVAADKTAEAANRTLRDSHIGLKESALATAAAAVRLADDQATAAGRTLDAADKAIIFRNALIDVANQADGPTKAAILGLADQVAGIPDRTVTVRVDTSQAEGAIASLQRRLNAIEAGASGSTSSGAQQFALGMDMGPVRGPAGKAVPIIAHAGEWVLTQAQLDALRRSGGSPSTSTVSTLSSSTVLSIVGPLVVVQGGVLPGQESSIGSAVEQAVTRLVANGTVGRAMSARADSISRR